VLTPVASIETKWNSLALSHDQFEQMVKIGRFQGNIQWLHFFALGCSSLSEVGLYVVFAYTYTYFLSCLISTLL